ncbi:MAG: bifunctional protein-serine/threonine kinase/phosphatase, partial [Spongiibacteraceae bacterium]
QTAVRTFIEDYYSTPDSWPVKTAAARVLSALNAWLFHHGQQHIARNALVTTFSAVILKSTTAHLLHAGDSRIYRWRAGSLELLTRDHQQRNRDGSFFLTRALGMDSRLEVDYIQEELEPADLLMLTTDGVHGVLQAAELSQLLATTVADRDLPSLEDKAKAIVGAALRKGSDDNLSCLLVRVDQLPIEDIDEVHRRLTQLKIPPVLEIGQNIDGYRVLRILHNGTRSHLYVVQNITDQKRYVLKAPSENFAEDAQYLEGFIREQWVGRRIDHPAVMKIYARPESSPFLYHLCEYIEGQTLRQWLFDNPRPALETVRNLTRDIITALRVFQRQHMVHRDLKPENVMLLADGHIKLIDFGTVYVSGLGEVNSPLREECPVGSADYIAPEYLLGDTGSHVSDIFSLGVMVYEMLTGKLPFNLPDMTRRPPQGLQPWRYQFARDRRQDLPLWVDLALQKATAPKPRERYQALSEFLQDICVPNADMLQERKSAPLLERDPVNFWRGVSLILFIVVLVEWVLLVKR